jgi:FtsP/CotA-like multicopper oxidase with cupredoxin domain
MVSFLRILFVLSLASLCFAGTEASDCTGRGTNIDFCGTLTFCDTGSTNFGYSQATGSGCISPGPVIRLEKGKRYAMRLENSVSGEVTNLHTHGLHISGDGHSDDVTRHVSSGNCLDYIWDLEHEVEGTKWYHAHHHGDTAAHVGGGAFGMIIVEDNYNDLNADAVQQAFLANERLLMVSKVGSSWRGNDQTTETISVVDDEWFRLRLAISDPAASARDFKRFGRSHTMECTHSISPRLCLRSHNSK